MKLFYIVDCDNRDFEDVVVVAPDWRVALWEWAQKHNLEWSDAMDTAMVHELPTPEGKTRILEWRTEIKLAHDPYEVIRRVFTAANAT